VEPRKAQAPRQMFAEFSKLTTGVAMASMGNVMTIGAAKS